MRGFQKLKKNSSDLYEKRTIIDDWCINVISIEELLLSLVWPISIQRLLSDEMNLWVKPKIFVEESNAVPPVTCVWEIAIYGVKVVVEKSECNAALAILHYTDYVLVKPSFFVAALWNNG